jgi:hypothetical protein
MIAIGIGAEPLEGRSEARHSDGDHAVALAAGRSMASRSPSAYTIRHDIQQVVRTTARHRDTGRLRRGESGRLLGVQRE